MAFQDSDPSRFPDYVLDKVLYKLDDVSALTDDGNSNLPGAVESFLSAVISAYEMIGEMTTADQQQVEIGLASAREMCVKCNHELKGGSFDGRYWKTVVTSTANTVRSAVNKARRLKVLKQLQLCERNLHGIEHSKHIEIAITEFKRLLRNTARLLDFIYKELRLSTFEGKRTRDHLLLCASQMHKCLPLLLRALEDRVNGMDSKQYVVRRLQVCLAEVRQVVEGRKESQDNVDDLGGGMFIVYMDQALSHLAVFDTSSTQTQDSLWWDAVETALRHAMLIAQVASQLDLKMIHGSAQKVMRESESLRQECDAKEQNHAVCKLLATSLSHALEELEQRVCAGVLRMYLQVFSEPRKPLEELLLQSWSSTSRGECCSDDLCDLVAAMDDHTERLTQVALFAIACSGDENRVLGIRSCLASLESLESQLVPALTALYLQQLPSQRALVRLLVGHWNAEVEQLGKLIDGIIDPAALAQVTHSVVWVPTATLKKALLKQREVPSAELTSLVGAVAKQGATLARQLQQTMQELGLVQQSALGMALQNLLQAVGECSALLYIIQQEERSLSLDRILKRCELLVSCVHHLQPLLEEAVDPQSSPGDDVVSVPTVLTNVAEKTVFQAREPPTPSRAKRYARLGLPPDADIEIDVTDSVDPCNPFKVLLDSTAAQPRLTSSFLYKEKSVLHSGKKLVDTPICTPRQCLFSRSHYAVTPLNMLQQTMCLDITNILEELSCLSPTHNSQSTASFSGSDVFTIPSCGPTKTINPPQEEPNNQAVEVRNCRPYYGEPMRSSGVSQISLASHNIGTPERMHDLLHVQQRIEAMKMSSHPSSNPTF